MMELIILLALLIPNGLGLNCSQITDSQIYEGSIIRIRGGDGQLQPIPPNYNCVYKIRTGGLFANVKVENGLRGPNDRIIVGNLFGSTYEMSSTSPSSCDRIVIPGTEITIQVITKSVAMNSKFLITVEYSNKTGPVQPLKTGGEMNFFEMSTLRNGQNPYITFFGNEPIFVTSDSSYAHPITCDDCYLIDGSIQNYTKIYRLGVIQSQPFETQTNYVTFLTSSDDYLGVVMNPVSETKPFNGFNSISPWMDKNWKMVTYWDGFLQAMQVVNFNSTGIILSQLSIQSQICKAFIVSGPPNNSSEVLLDLSMAEIPHVFADLQYFTVINEDCVFDFTVKAH